MDEFTIPVGAFHILNGSPALGTAQAFIAVGWLFDASADERIAAGFAVPTGWQSFAVDLIWMNAGAAGAGNVVWHARIWPASDGSDISAATQITQAQTVAAPTVGVVKKTTFHAAGAAVPAGSLASLQIIREGNSASDTLANDASLVGVTIRKVS